MTDELRLYPAWRQLEADLLAEGLPDDTTVSMQRLRDGFGLRDPKDLPGDEAIKEQAIFNFSMGELKASLLANHRISIRLVPCMGYQVTHPKDQTRLALKDHGAEVVNALSRATQKVTHVRHELLDDAQRRENADAQAKLATLSAFTTRKLASSPTTPPSPPALA